MSELSSPGRDVGKTGIGRRIGIVSLSAIADDPRVRRQGDALAAAGWQVVAIGLPSTRSAPPAWRCLEIGAVRAVAAEANYAGHPQQPVGSRSSLRGRLVRILPDWAKAPLRFLWIEVRWALAALRCAVAASRSAVIASINLLRNRIRARMRPVLRPIRILIQPAIAERLYWSLNDKFPKLLDLAQQQQVDLWLANDWTSLPAVREVARQQSVPFAYDTHELAIDEYSQRWTWRFAQRPLIAAIERMGIRDAAYVSCVSDGIAQRIAQFYRMPEPPLVIRNMPHYEECAFRLTGQRIRVLYHGIVSPGRGLEACIESVCDWRPEFDLTIRGPGSADYLARLARLSRDHSVESRVTFAEAVPMVDLVRAAAASDVGLFVLPSHSLQNVYALPNKLFEYMMAGLALCMSDLPEIARILTTHKAGVLVETTTPDVIAKRINGLDRDAIDAYKRNALAAARTLNWQMEGQKLLAACDQAVSGI